MRAEVIAVGDELTSGQRVDTNSAWLSQQLTDLGVRLLYHTTVGDCLLASVAALRVASQRVDVVVCTGGLGPTADDLTRQALAEASGRPLRLDQGVLEHIRGLFARRGRSMPPSNDVQAMFPEGSHVIANPHGTAPGIDLEIASTVGRTCRVFALPGVPAEMRQMWHQTVQPRLLAAGAGQRTIRHRQIHCFGVGESQLEQMLPDLIRRGRTPSVGITAHQATITLRISAEGADTPSCDAAMQETVQTIYGCLGELVFGEQDDQLQDAVTYQLQQQGSTLATAESGTQGLIAHWLASTASAVPVYKGGLVACSGAGLWRLMTGGSCPDVADGWLTAQRQGDWTGDMARRLRQVMQTDYALVVGPPESPTDAGIPTVMHISLATAGEVSHISHRLVAHPDIVVPWAAKQALDWLRLHLIRRGRT